MSEKIAADDFASIWDAGTSAPNFDLGTDEIVAQLKAWQSLCKFRIVAAGPDTVDVEFDTLPQDMDAFAAELYKFCPDLVDQGTGCIHELVEAAEECGEELDAEMQALIEGIDFADENYGVEILKRELAQKKKIPFWWD